eukprot:11433981-Karenia_brevis.AAC.1
MRLTVVPSKASLERMQINVSGISASEPSPGQIACITKKDMQAASASRNVGVLGVCHADSSESDGDPIVTDHC